MLIQVNTDKSIEGSQRMSNYYTAIVEEELSRFADQITRVQVHLGDENGGKQGDNDKRCMIEVRIKGMEPLAVTAHAASPDAAVTTALEKVKHAIEHAVGKLKKHPVRQEDLEGA